jgi:hypothetical protein
VGEILPVPATTLRTKALCQLHKHASLANHARSASLHAPRNATMGRARNRPLTPQNHRGIVAGTTILESCRPHAPRILAKGHGSPPRGSNAPITVRLPLTSSDYKVPSRTLASPILHTPPPWWPQHTAPFQRGEREEGKRGKGGSTRRNSDRGGTI